ncbi:MAG: hypothetical protein GY857_17915 [Desulfobacula sp.]|nr:hypothetical protein [Desulfobacula sp.]
MTLLFMTAIRIYCIFKPDQGPKGEKFTFKEIILSLKELWESQNHDMAVLNFFIEAR